MAIENLSVMQAVAERAKNRLARLARDAAEDEVSPTEDAGRACIDLLTAAAGAVSPGRSFPFPHLSTAGEGDLSCEWRGENRVVVAAVSPEGVVSVYRFQMSNGRAQERETLPQPTAADLVRTVEWLLAEETSSP